MAVQLVLGLLVAAACLWWAARSVAWDDFRGAVARADYRLAPLMAILIVGFFWLKAVRWRLLLRPVKPMSLGDVTGPLLVGFMANNLLPAHLGELIRVHVLGRTQQVSRASVLSTVVLERLFDLTAILGFLGVGLLADSRLRTDYLEAVIAFSVATGLVLVGAIAFVVAPEGCVRVVEWVCSKWLRFIPQRWRQGLLETVRAGARGLQALRQPDLVAAIVFTSLLQWLLMGLMVYFSLETYGETNALLPSFVVVGVIAVAILVPAPPGYVGVIQLCFIKVLDLYGVDEVTALAGSVYFHFWQFVPVTLAGLWCLRRSGLRWRELAEATDSPGASGATETSGVGGESSDRTSGAD